MDIHARPVLLYRWFVFLLAGGYCLYQILFGYWAEPFGPFRFLTIWALFLSFYSASRMLALTEARIERKHEVTAMCASVLNVMVVYLYWKLYFTDPNLVNNAGRPPPWHQEYYLHLAGPALQIFDALFISRAFKRVWRAIAPLLGIIGVYVLWAEFVLQRFGGNEGSVTSGLPYPFLNNMELAGRMSFYGANAAVAVALLAAFGILAMVLYRALPDGPKDRMSAAG